jgi:hypothetical protein
MPEPYRFDLPVSRDQLEALGMVVTEWAYLESVIDAAIGLLAYIGDADTLAALTANHAFQSRFSTLQTLHALGRSNHGHDTEDSRRRFLDLCREIEKLQAERNRLIHSRWIVGAGGSPLTFWVRARTALKRERRGAAASDVLLIAARIAEASRGLCELFRIDTSELDSFT